MNMTCFIFVSFLFHKYSIYIGYNTQNSSKIPQQMKDNGYSQEIMTSMPTLIKDNGYN